MLKNKLQSLFASYPIPVVVSLLSVLIVFVYFRKNVKNGKKFPPGPRGLPFIGSFLEFRNAPITSMTKWRKKYGNIVGLRIGTYRVVMLSDIKILKEAFQNSVFNSRPPMKQYIAFSGGSGHGSVTASSNDSWDEVRRFTIKQLNDVGFGRRSTEEVLKWNLKHMLEYFKNAPPSLCLYEAITAPITSYAWQILTGHELSYQSTLNLRDAISNFEKVFLVPIGTPLWMMPEVVDWFPTWTGLTATKFHADKLHGAIKMFVDRIRKSLKLSKAHCLQQDSETPSNLLEAFVWKIWQSETDPDSSFHRQAGDDNMLGTVMNMLFTGVVGLANPLNWAFAFVALKPEVETKIFGEIVDVMGPTLGRLIELADMEAMPYTVAFMKEVLRMSSTAPYSNFHTTTADVDFHGYFIPKDTVIIGNLYDANHDEEIYGDPFVFRPERYLGVEGQKTPSYLSFSVGLRTCPGQVYTRNSFFIYFVTMCQHFKIRFDETVNPAPVNEAQICSEGLVSVFRCAKKYTYVLEKRDEIGETGIKLPSKKERFLRQSTLEFI